MSFQADRRILVCTLAAYGSNTRPAIFDRLLASAKRFGISVEVFAEGTPFIDFYQLKILRLYEELLKRQDSYDVVVYVDGDSVFSAPLNELMHKYTSNVVPFVFAGNHLCWPNPEFSDFFPPSPTRFRWIDAGGWVASKTYLLSQFKILTTPFTDGVPARRNPRTDDQACWNYTIARGKVVVNIDHWTNIFLFTPAPLQWKNNRIQNSEFGSAPCILNGQSVDFLEKNGLLSELI